jgi:integrase/recombinase XerD
MNYRRCSCPVWVVGMIGGKAIRKSLDTANWDEGESKLKDLRDGKSVPPVRLSDACSRFIADASIRGLASDTLYKYRLLISEMESVLPQNLETIDADRLARFREGWKMSPVTARKKLERMKAIFRFFCDRGWVQRNPAAPLKPPKGTPPPTLPFSDEEVKTILEACDNFPNKGIYSFGSRDRVRAFVLVLLNTGLRIRDVVMLTRDRFQGNRLVIRTQKSGGTTHVSIPLKPGISEAVMRICVGERPFWSGNGLPKSCVADWQRTLRRVFKLANVDGGHAHRFRDTFSVNLLNHGVPVESVASVLGNSPAIVLKHYAPWVASRQAALDAAVMSTWS